MILYYRQAPGPVGYGGEPCSAEEALEAVQCLREQAEDEVTGECPCCHAQAPDIEFVARCVDRAIAEGSPLQEFFQWNGRIRCGDVEVFGGELRWFFGERYAAFTFEGELLEWGELG